MRRGIFAMPHCNACNKWIWPPSRLCGICYNTTDVRPYTERGIILECSAQNDVVFCMCEFPGRVRVMGRLMAGSRHTGSTVTISNCGINQDGPFFEFKG